MGNQTSPIIYKCKSSSQISSSDIHNDVQSLKAEDWSQKITPCEKIAMKHSLSNLEIKQQFKHYESNCSYDKGRSQVKYKAVGHNYVASDLDNDIHSLTEKDWSNGLKPCKRMCDKHSLSFIRITQRFGSFHINCTHRGWFS